MWDLRCQGLREPRGIGELRPRLSWRGGAGAGIARPAAWRILVARDPEAIARRQGDLWDSGVVPGDAAGARYAGAPLGSRSRCSWGVALWGRDGEGPAWSDAASFGVGLLERSDWSGTFIGHRAPCPQLRRPFRVPGPVKRATLHVAALGVVTMTVDGTPVSAAELAPGYVDGDARVPARSYDVTLDPGDHVLGAILAPGWYAGHFGIHARASGRRPALLCQLEIELEQGASLTVASGDDWRAHAGELLAADLLMGEERDLRRGTPGWDRPGFDDAAWDPVEPRPWPDAPIRPHAGPPVVRGEELPARDVACAAGRRLLDVGQNVSGRVRLRAAGAGGDRLVLRHGEILDAGGALYVANLRAARATDAVTLQGSGIEAFEPRFTTHGFRYVELTGPVAAVASAELAGVPVHTELATIGRFSCSSAMLVRLHEAVRWTLRNNALEVPTDCPQRDERLGWTGDAQIAAQAWLYLLDVEAFFRKWLDDLADAQDAGGLWPDVAPRDPEVPWSTVGWADATITICELLHLFRDVPDVLERHHEGMARWMAAQRDPLPSCRYGDWIGSGPATPKRLLGGALHAASAGRMARIAAALGRGAEAARWRVAGRRIVDAFRRRFLDAGGSLRRETQTGLALALAHDLLPAELRPAAAERLRRRVEEEGMRTGFVGTGPLLDVLAEHGHLRTAYALLESVELPSWGFMLAQGATTIWERWDGHVPGRGFQDPAMNSFDHPPLAAVGAFLHAKVAGIEPLAPGFSRARIRPRPGGTLVHASASHLTPRGEISVAWWREGARLRVEATIPPGCDAELWIGGTRTELAPGRHAHDGELALSD